MLQDFEWWFASLNNLIQTDQAQVSTLPDADGDIPDVPAQSNAAFSRYGGFGAGSEEIAWVLSIRGSIF